MASTGTVIRPVSSAKAGIDAVSDLQRARMSYDFPVRGFTCARNVAEVVAGKPLQPQWQVAAHQILEDAVEAPAQLRVGGGRPHEGQPLCVHPTDKGLPVRRVEEVDTAEIFGSGTRGQVKVGISDPIDDPALDERPLIQARVELERHDRDMPSHGLPVDDGPSRPTY